MVIETFSGLTHFDEVSEDLSGSEIGPELVDHDLFSEQLRLIGQLSNIERQKTMSPISCTKRLDVQHFYKSLTDASERSRRLGEGFIPIHLAESFDSLVEAFHRAGLIYAYQVLVTEEDAEAFIYDLHEELFRVLQSIDGDDFAQNLAWPLFIAGTECRNDEEKQKWIEDKIKETNASMGFNNGHPVVLFLRTFWASLDNKRGQCWIRFARDYRKDGSHFFVF
ncbi:hypothetical protein UCRPC4_g01395 [Phaeomoniella chlamydospora]|uniref:Uncharacterized protein n=1 Tax=Phaeomoniella chlamydospora TaxID=158046 RepID=A0A0G2HDW2_PHACM|nr:hypothetical protein UCRPC4_g01395 [Phaeomoniella chlamydospora]